MPALLCGSRHGRACTHTSHRTQCTRRVQLVPFFRQSLKWFKQNGSNWKSMQSLVICARIVTACCIYFTAKNLGRTTAEIVYPLTKWTTKPGSTPFYFNCAIVWSILWTQPLRNRFPTTIAKNKHTFHHHVWFMWFRQTHRDSMFFLWFRQTHHHDISLLKS